jgi:hypothetical protein
MGKRQVVNTQLTKLSASWAAETDKRRVGLLLQRDGRVALEHTTIMRPLPDSMTSCCGDAWRGDRNRRPSMRRQPQADVTAEAFETLDGAGS